MSMGEIFNPKEKLGDGGRAAAVKDSSTFVRLEGIEGNEGVLSQFFPSNIHRRNDPEEVEGDASPYPM